MENQDPPIPEQLRRLEKLPYAGRLIVFDSAAGSLLRTGRGLDVCLDLRPDTFLAFLDRNKSGPAAPLDAYRHLLRIAARYPGALRAFLRFEDRLLVSGDDASRWLSARARRELCVAIDSEGMSLAAFKSGRTEGAERDTVIQDDRPESTFHFTGLNIA